MKKNTIMRIAAVVLMCTLVTACFASSTFAKYTSGATTSKTAKVATWVIKANDEKIADNFSLTEGKIFEGNAYGTDEENADKIAPGTCGSLTFSLKNESEVDAEYLVEVTKGANMPAHITLYKDSAFTQEIDDKGITGDLLRTATAATDVTIYWNWEFTDDDETEIAGEEVFDIDVEVTVDQKD